MPLREIVIPTRFRGPPDRGNGGVTAGLLATRIDGPAEVTLRRPAPLETRMTVESTADGIALTVGDELIAEGRTIAVDFDAPPALSLEVAQDAAESSPVTVHPEWHPFPGCFVCGTERAEGDGLRVHPGRVGTRELFAAPVDYPADLADASGAVPAELLWAALDCPSSFVMYMGGERPANPYVLGRIAARIISHPPIEAVLVVLSWPLGVDGRKLFAASALYDGEDVVAVARATWISI